MPGALLTASLNQSGQVSSITVVEAGSGYTAPPRLVVSGSAQATATVSNGQIVGASVTDPGSGYTEAPQVFVIDGVGERVNVELLAPISNPQFSGVVSCSALSTTDATVSRNLILNNAPAGGQTTGDTLFCRSFDQNAQGNAYIRGPLYTPNLLSTVTSNAVMFDSSTGRVTYSAVDTNPTSASSRLITSGGVHTALGLKQNNLTLDSSPTVGSQNPVTSGGVATALGLKQNNLTFDSSPTVGSQNPVTSGGVATALSLKANLQNPTFSGSVSLPNTSVAGTLSLPGVATGTNSNVLYYGSGGAVTYGAPPASGGSTTVQQAFFGTNGSLSLGSANGQAINFNNNGTNGITNLTFSSGNFSVPAGTYVVTWQCHTVGNIAAWTIYFQTGAQVNVSQNGSTNDCYKACEGVQTMTMQYVYNFTATPSGCSPGRPGRRPTLWHERITW
jgi:hypothetical protein